MKTLTQSGALWELHAWKNSFSLAARFEKQRLRIVHRAIRRQRLAVFLLSCRVFFSPFRTVDKPLPARALHHVSEDGKSVETISALPLPAAMTIRLCKPKLFSILTFRGQQWIVVGSDGFLFCHIVHLKMKLN